MKIFKLERIGSAFNFVKLIISFNMFNINTIFNHSLNILGTHVLIVYEYVGTYFSSFNKIIIPSYI